MAGLELKQRQWMQVGGLPESDRERGYYFDAALVMKAMAGWRFPYHFIDFETAAVALPFHAGMRPYQSVAFQFSHHVLEASGELRHAGQFLCATPGIFPNFDFARALLHELGNDEGTVFMWSHHENTILSGIAAQLASEEHPPAEVEALQEFLTSLTKGGTRAMVDLCNLAAKAYFHPDTRGSSSIKKVLPATLKSSQLLKERYSQPIYGAPGGIPSLNFASAADSPGSLWTPTARQQTRTQNSRTLRGRCCQRAPPPTSVTTASLPRGRRGNCLCPAPVRADGRGHACAHFGGAAALLRAGHAGDGDDRRGVDCGLSVRLSGHSKKYVRIIFW